MSKFQSAALVTCVYLLALQQPCSGLDLKNYSSLPVEIQCEICRDAALSNPNVVKTLNLAAERCIKQIQCDIPDLDKARPVLRALKVQDIKRADSSRPECVMCALMFLNHTRQVEYSSAIKPVPLDDGLVLVVWICNRIAPVAGMWPEVSAHTEFFVHGMEMHASYYLQSGDKNKDLEKPMRAIIEKQLKVFCEEAKKLQTAEDRSAKP